MSDTAWIVGTGVTLWFAWLSVYARRWWPLCWLAAIFFSMGTGVLIAAEHKAAAGLWWTFWLGYTPTLPIVRVWRARKRERNIYDES